MQRGGGCRSPTLLSFYNGVVRPYGGAVGELKFSSQLRFAGGKFNFEDHPFGLSVDLLRFFDALESQTPGLFSVQRCALTRRQAEIVIDAVERNLDASCELSWYTLELSGGRRVAL